MTITSFIKGMFNLRIAGENTIATFEDMYRRIQQHDPSAEPHTILQQCYLTRIATHGKNPKDPSTQYEAIQATTIFACIQPYKNVRALAIQFIALESPAIIKSHPEFLSELEELLRPLNDAIQSADETQGLYKKWNPKLHLQHEKLQTEYPSL